MEIIERPEDMQARALQLRREGRTIGFVPTMGYLHEAHASLMRIARGQCDVLVVSNFVNPIQFGPNEDYDRYPRDLERDRAVCEKEGVDIIFLPSATDMYPEGDHTVVEDLALSGVIEGARRPGHFRGVTTIVAKLFNIVLPDLAVFGEKDAQQLRIITDMVRALNFPVHIVPGPIVREADGLAMSSRNAYLDPETRRQAVCLSQALKDAQALYDGGERKAGTLKEAVRRRVDGADRGTLDYVEIVDEASFAPVETLAAPARILLVVKFGAVRLLDNLLLKQP